MSRETENVVLLLSGITTAMISIVGTYTRYVKPSLLPWLLTAAVLLIVLALSAIVRDIRRGHGDEDGHGHPHNRGIAWLLVLPIAILNFVTPPALGAQAAAPSAAAVSNGALHQAFPPLPAGRAPVVELPEVLRRVVNDTAGTLTGRLITIVGFTLKDKPPGVDLGRVVIFCCAADAQLARIHLVGPAAAIAAELPDNSWIQVEGTVVPAPRDAGALTIPDLTVTRVTQIDPPANTYSF